MADISVADTLVVDVTVTIIPASLYLCYEVQAIQNVDTKNNDNEYIFLQHTLRMLLCI